MTSSLIGRRACLAVLIASLWAATTGSVRVTAQDVGTEAQRESGKTLYLKNCSQCHGEKGDGRRLRHPAPVAAAPQLHDGQVQGSDDSQRSAPEPSGPRQHHQARHALHVDARLANTHRSGSGESRLLHYDLLPRFLEQGKRSQAGAAPERAELDEGVDRDREETLRGHRLRQVPRQPRSGRRTFGSNPGGRPGPSDTRGGPLAGLDPPRRLVPRGYLQDDEHGTQRHAHGVVL